MALVKSASGKAISAHHHNYAGPGDRKMPESAAHAPGREISGEGDAVRQRNRMGEGGSAMSGRFDVEDFASANRTGGRNHGAHMAHDGVTLADHERAGPPTIPMGAGNMGATAHSNHGPHHHDEVGGKRRK